jgi:arylsulfatase A-like enzyme
MTLQNIALITLDSFRADVVSKEHTRNILKIAGHGVYFENAFSNSSTTIPSMISLFSSTYPNMLGGFSSLKRRRTISEILRGIGYKTIGINTNAFVEVIPGFDKGFNVFENLRTDYGTILLRKFIRNSLSERIDSFIDHFKYALNENYIPSVRGDLVVKETKRLLERIREKPIFLWLHFMDTHHPYKPPAWISDINLKNPITRFYYSFKQRRYTALAKEYEREIYWKLYLNCAKYVDHCVGRISEELLDDSWILIITSDHGDEFFEHGGVSHSRKLYDELIHVPLIIYGVDDLKSSSKILLSHVDIIPTILDLLGVRDRRDLFVGMSVIDKDESYTYSEHEKIRAIRTMSHKLIIDEKYGKIELYDLKKDPEERRNISDYEEDVVRELTKKLIDIAEKAKGVEAKYDVLRLLNKSGLK